MTNFARRVAQPEALLRLAGPSWPKPTTMVGRRQRYLSEGSMALLDTPPADQATVNIIFTTRRGATRWSHPLVRRTR